MKRQLSSLNLDSTLILPAPAGIGASAASGLPWKDNVPGAAAPSTTQTLVAGETYVVYLQWTGTSTCDGVSVSGAGNSATARGSSYHSVADISYQLFTIINVTTGGSQTINVTSWTGGTPAECQMWIWGWSGVTAYDDVAYRNVTGAPETNPNVTLSSFTTGAHQIAWVWKYAAAECTEPSGFTMLDLNASSMFNTNVAEDTDYSASNATVTFTAASDNYGICAISFT